MYDDKRIAHLYNESNSYSSLVDGAGKDRHYSLVGEAENTMLCSLVSGAGKNTMLSC